MMLLLLACDASKESGNLGESGPGTIDERLVLGEVQACENPASTTSYTEVGGAWNLQEPMNNPEKHEESASFAVGDLDGNGGLDVVNFNREGTSYLYMHQGDHFEASQLSLMFTGMGGLLFDFDGDGDVDLAGGGQTPFMMYNEGGGNFINGPLLPNMPDWVSRGVMVHDFEPGDFNGDGVLDFFWPVTLDEKEGALVFNDVILFGNGGSYSLDDTVVDPVVGNYQGMDVVVYDEDGDGDMDAYVVNDFGSVYGPGSLLRNNNGKLEDSSESCYCALLTNSKGVDIDDYNRDGLPDVYIVGNPQNALLERLEDGTYVDVTRLTQTGANDENATGWGGGFLDFNNDGWRDIIPAQGDRWNSGNDHPHFESVLKLLKQEDGVFTDVAQEMGMTATGSFRAVSMVDFNADGVEDLLIAPMDSRPLLYLSDSCTEAGWIEIEAPLGSKVAVEVDGVVQTNWVRVDSGYLSTRPAVLHFGLGEAQSIDRLTITLPGGDVIEATAPIEGRRRVVLPQ
jgi:hypothetical protein